MTPHSPAASIVYSLWLRSRLIMGLSLLGTFACCAVATALDPVPRVVMGTGAGLAFISGLALLIGAVTYGGADLSTPESVYPRHVMAFPASTRTLVGVPMLYGTLIVALYWMAVSGAMGPVGFKLPVLWPAGMMAAMVAWLQAASWSPYRFPFLRVGVILLILAVLIPIGVAGQLHSAHPAVAAALSAAVGVLAYPVALTGVARARRGDGVTPRQARMVERRPDVASTSPLRFQSASAAQLWFELLRNVWYPPAITALVEVIFFITFASGRKAHPNVFLPAWVPPGLPPLCVLFAVPLFIVMVHAIVLGKFDMWTKSLDYPAFFLTRPLSTAAIVAGKLRAAALVTVIMWAVAGVTIVAFACLPHTYDANRSWAGLLLHNASWRGAAAVSTAVLLLGLMTWGQMARSFWISMSGKTWMVHVFPTASMLAWGVVGWSGYRVHQNPVMWHAVAGRAGWLLEVSAIIKVLLSIALFAYLVRRSLLRPSIAMATFSAWLAVCGFFCAVLAGISEPLRHAMPAVAAAVALFLPLFRPTLAVLVLHYNRHR